MFRPPFLARVAAGTVVYALEETRRLPTTAANLPITAISRLLQTSMHVQQFVTSLALKGDAVFDRFANPPVDQPEWATFDEDTFDEDDAPISDATGADTAASARASRFDLFAVDDLDLPAFAPPEPLPDEVVANGRAASTPVEPEIAEPEPAPASEIAEPEIATRYDYAGMTLAQLRARLRMLTVEDLATLLEYERQTRARAPFVTMLTNRIATVQAQ